MKIDKLLLRLPPEAAGAHTESHELSTGNANLPPMDLCNSSFARACAARRALMAFAGPKSRNATPSSITQSSAVEGSASGTPAMEMPLLLRNCRVLDTQSMAYLPGLQKVVIRCGAIESVEPQDSTEQDTEAPEVDEVQAAVVIDCRGTVLMPGLCDAHVHCTAVTANLGGMMSLSESYVAARAAHILGGMLARGFTTIRDAGGADFGLAQAVDEGLVLGPKILFTGHALSQTGGHGDFRGRGEDMCACGAALRGIGRVCDGDAEVRRAARDELRRGAHCIKIMASGGVASPTDRLTNTQFSEAELTAIVEEAAAAGTYVCAHAYMPDAIQRAVRCGVRSIEHGNYLDDETAQLMAEKGVYLVPTIVTYQELSRGGAAAGMPPDAVAKVGDAVDAGLQSLAVARRAGVTMCFGSDLLGDLHPAQAGEFALRSRVLPPAEVLRAATVNCAKLFGMEFSLGKVAPGYTADLLLLAPGVDPLVDGAALAAPGGAAVAAVFKDGLLAKFPAAAAATGAGAGGGRRHLEAEQGEAAVADMAAVEAHSVVVVAAALAAATESAVEEGGVRPRAAGNWAVLNERLFPSRFWPRA